MSRVSNEPFEPIPATNGANQPVPLIAWRSLSISVLIAIVAEVLFIVAATHLHIRLYDAPQWQNDVLDWVMEYHGVVPICVGGVYLALKVQHRWMLQSAIYICGFLLLAIISLVFREYAAALRVVVRVVPCYVAISLMRLLVKKYFTRANVFESSNEKIKFGFTTLFWGSTLVALLVSLVMWTGKAFTAASDERMTKMKIASEERQRQYKIDRAKIAQDYLVLIGGDYDKDSEHIVLRPGEFRKRPIDDFFGLLIRELGEITSIEFIDCEVTDETIAELQKARAQNEPFSVSFVNCTVIKDPNPSGTINTKNVKLGPLSGGVP